jgi:ribonuclease G
VLVTNDLIIDVSPAEVSLALLEDKRLAELQKEKPDNQYAVGNIYLGRVRKVMPGLNAAFIDIGYEKDAFLHYLDLGPQFQSLNNYVKLALARKGKMPIIQKFRSDQDINKNGKINEVLTPGQLIVVQITKEPISTKGPRLTCEISIAGRNLVLIPFSDKVSVSSKIESGDERNRLKTLLQSIRPRNYGIIVRTVAETKMVAELDTELMGLLKKWETAIDSLRGLSPPKLILSELKRTSAILRDLLNMSFNSIVVNDEDIYHDIRDYIGTIAPEKQKIVKHHSGSTPIFEHFGVDKMIKGSFGKTISFKNGAYLIIEHTEALHVIDVNSGNRAKSAKDQESNSRDVNLAAAEEVARQLRLRDMGGIIVVDFIDMQNNDHRQMVYEKMKEFMSRDRAKHNILPLSKFGLMQITRQRVRPEMAIDTIEKCPSCNGTGMITPAVLLVEQIESKMSFFIEKENLKKIVIKVHPYVAAYLTTGLFSLRFKWALRYRCKIAVDPVYAYHFLEYKFYNAREEELLQ